MRSFAVSCVIGEDRETHGTGQAELRRIVQADGAEGLAEGVAALLGSLFP
jgi:hypothetical protein